MRLAAGVLSVGRMRKFAFILGLVLATATAAEASLIYACPGESSECEGQTFAVWLDDSGSGFVDIALSINTSGYDGLLAGALGDYAYSVALADSLLPGLAYTDVTLTSAPGGVGSWNAALSPLSAVWSKPDSYGYSFTVGEIMTWMFRATTTAGMTSSTSLFQYGYLDGDGSLVAGLLSQDVSIQDCQNGQCNPVPMPEPATLTMLGLGLLGAAAVGRRRSRRR